MGDGFSVFTLTDISAALTLSMMSNQLQMNDDKTKVTLIYTFLPMPKSMNIADTLIKLSMYKPECILW